MARFYETARRNRYATSSAQTGITLIELMVVLAILGTLTAIALPRMGLIQDHRVYGAARLVWTDMQHAKMLAIKENRNVPVVFTSHGYDFHDIAGTSVYYRDLTSEYKDVTLASSGGTITFNSRGVLSPPPTSTTITVSLGDRSRSFTISRTGRIGDIS